MNTEDRSSSTERGKHSQMTEQNKRNSVSKFRRITHHPEIVRSGEWEWGVGSGSGGWGEQERAREILKAEIENRQTKGEFTAF